MTTINWSTEQTDIFTWFETSKVPSWAVWGAAPSLVATAAEWQGRNERGPFQLVEAKNLLARARAGTGKTTTMVEGAKRAPERKILIAAFNVEIREELQRRIHGHKHIEAKTLHGLGFAFIRYYSQWGTVNVEDGDERGQRAWDLAERAIGEDAPKEAIKLVSDLHSKAREINPLIVNAGTHRFLFDLAARFNHMPDEELEAKGYDLDRICEAAHKAMGYAKERTNVIDFADMIFLPIVHGWIRPWYELGICDEAQDMTEAQLILFRRAVKRTGRICVVGDDRQAIYAFRGADSGSLDRLKAELKAAELGLKTTYRCGKSIVNLAATLVPDFRCPDSAHDGAIANCDAEMMLDAVREGDFIISRTNAPLIRICMALLKRGVRARIRGRDIGRGVIALVKRLKGESIADLEAKLVHHLVHEAERAQKLSEAAREERLALVQDQVEVVRVLAENASSVEDLMARCADLFADDLAAVTCMTAHKAKGLETANTFLLAGTFKSGRTEEDNIKYVGITRAKNRLTWVAGYESGPAKVAA